MGARKRETSEEISAGADKTQKKKKTPSSGVSKMGAHKKERRLTSGKGWNNIKVAWIQFRPLIEGSKKGD